MKGSNEKQVGNIILTCMSKEARDLLDVLVEKYQEETGKHIREINGYQALYWACRYSGLIEKASVGGK